MYTPKLFLDFPQPIIGCNTQSSSVLVYQACVSLVVCCCSLVLGRTEEPDVLVVCLAALRPCADLNLPTVNEIRLGWPQTHSCFGSALLFDKREIKHGKGICAEETIELMSGLHSSEGVTNIPA